MKIQKKEKTRTSGDVGTLCHIMIVALSTCISLFVCVKMKKGLGWTHGGAWLRKELLTGLIICTVDCTLH